MNIEPTKTLDTIPLSQKWVFTFVIIISSLTIAYGVYSESYLLLLLPLLGISAMLILRDFSPLFYLFFIVVPFSIEYNFTDSLGTDLPSEPIMWILTGISILLILSDVKKYTSGIYFTKITKLLLLHLIWLFITTVSSSFPILSAKIMLAKIWYVLPFYFLSIHFLRNHTDIEKIKSIIFTLSAAVLIVLYRHSLIGFTFNDVNFVVSPLFRNHVSYACIIVVMVPYVWYLFVWSRSKMKWLYGSIILLLVTGTYFSYTRAAIIALAASVVFYFIIRLRLVKSGLIIALLVSVIGIYGLLYNNNYLRFTPDFNKTVTHQKFDKLITATVEMEDISTMERVYRWVAGVEMVKDKPLLGFGPGTFYNNYKAYTVSTFQTYVSDNPDHSTVHCYYLLTLIEQGVFGFLIFGLLCIYGLILGERKYHTLRNRKDKTIIMAAALSLIIILLINLINDMIETDKVGPFFFMALAIIGSYEGEDAIQNRTSIDK
jgi:O-antigen ligase